MNNAEQSKDAGAMLKAKRLELGHTHESVRRVTKIPVKALDALERNDCAFFPARVYADAFALEYCEFLGLDFNTLGIVYQKPAPEAAEKEEPPAPFPVETSWGDTGAKPGAFAAGFAMLSLILLLPVFLWLWRIPPGKKIEPVANPSYPVTGLVSAAGKSTLKADFTARTWMRVLADDQIVFEGYAPGGASREWTAAKNFKVRVEPPRQVHFTLDERPLPEEFAGKNELVFSVGGNIK